MSDWRVELEGHEFDLRALEGVPAESGERVVKVDGEYFITGGAVSEAANAQDALNLARSLLPVLNGLGRVFKDGFQPVRLQDGVRSSANPQKRIVFGEVHMFGRGELSVGGVSLAGVAEHAIQSKGTGWGVAMRMVGAPQAQTWQNLYKVFEVLREEAGGQQALLQRLGLAKKQLDRFTRSANDPNVTGAEARHGTFKQPTVSDPMTLDDAERFVAQMLRDW